MSGNKKCLAHLERFSKEKIFAKKKFLDEKTLQNLSLFVALGTSDCFYSTSLQTQKSLYNMISFYQILRKRNSVNLNLYNR